MIENIEELKEKISHLKEDEQEEFIKIVKPFYDFYDYMKLNFNKTYDDIEKESAALSKEVLPEYLSKLKDLSTVTESSSLEFIVSISGSIYKKYAESYNYPNADDVEKALTRYIELTLKYNLSDEK